MWNSYVTQGWSCEEDSFLLWFKNEINHTFEWPENVEDFKSSKSLIKSKTGCSENEIWVSMGKRQLRWEIFLRSQKSLNKNTRYVYEEWRGGNNQGRVVSVVEDALTWVISPSLPNLSLCNENVMVSLVWLPWVLSWSKFIVMKSF